MGIFSNVGLGLSQLSYTTRGSRPEIQELKSLGRRKDNNKNYVMLILHQIKLMTSNGSSIQLILLEMNLGETERKNTTWSKIEGSTGKNSQLNGNTTN